MKFINRLLFLLLIVSVAVSLFGCKSKAPENYDSIYDRAPVALDVNKDGKFTILKINDTHFINGRNKKDRQTLDDLRYALGNCTYDMIIVDGDLVEGYNKSLSYDKYGAASKFAEIIESTDVPWTFAPGNNDGERGGTNEELIAFLMQYEHFVCGNVKDIDGAMQFFIDLKSNGQTVHSIAVMDSLSHDENGEYDHIRQSQIDWLVGEIESRRVMTSLFFHMPTPAFKEAYENGVAYEGFPFCDAYAVDDVKKNAEFDEAISDNEYISLISVAHVHSDNIAYFYNGRYYQLSSLGGYNAVGSGKTKPSYTLITIDTAASDKMSMYKFEKIEAKD